VRSLQSSATIAVFALSFVAGCGSEASLVGGRCRDGMELHGNTCVAPPGSVAITPNDPPQVTGASGNSSAIKTSATPALPAPPTFVPDPNSDPAHEAPDAVHAPQLDPPVPPPPPVALVCDAPLAACHGVCIPVVTDAHNCGACGKICPSNICIDGECQGATPGDVVLIGHDYRNALAGSAQTKVLVNALSIPTTDPIRVLSYEDGAAPAAVTMAKLLASGGLHGREIQFTIAGSASDLASSTLARSYDVVLVHDASAGDPVTTGASWADSLGTFTMKGGVVVALDNGLSPMPELLTSSALLAVTSHTLMADGTHLAVTGAGDVVGAQVLSPYAGYGPSITFQGMAAPNVDFDWVVRATDAGGALGDPVVLHRVVRDAQ
jgi:hypothetical protein